ncbi:Na+/H+ antiporter subunit G [Marivita geojedonensis]|uniref:Cation:proton antiporter n=1 Tax=Marivita geojedonensis TaxID=1123756 RepID=A0A1X4NRE2_9RHOB|nr:Na+/H+ antiporter subunit G [Marivita geojedonensis]OSQ53477.1 cation:proton antiporter [Marivita geojedonensis]PRY81530.1 multisubunit potassium/proton antiporter PhaG subunit [Marivita geojedonensis]
MSFVTELLIAISLVVSGVFGLVGSYGLVKLQDSLQRLHAPTKATTLGVGGVLIASMLYFFAKTDHLSIHELLITVFLLLTAPITANFIAKTYMARNLKESDLPDSQSSCGWSVFDEPPEQTADK